MEGEFFTVDKFYRKTKKTKNQIFFPEGVGILERSAEVGHKQGPIRLFYKGDARERCEREEKKDIGMETKEG